MSDWIRQRVVVTGQVQGVFFRDTHAAGGAAARRLGLGAQPRATGRSRRCSRGPPDAVGALVDFCSRGPRGASVAAVDVRDEPPEGLRGFEVR